MESAAWQAECGPGCRTRETKHEFEPNVLLEQWNTNTEHTAWGKCKTMTWKEHGKDRTIFTQERIRAERTHLSYWWDTGSKNVHDPYETRESQNTRGTNTDTKTKKRITKGIIINRRLNVNNRKGKDNQKYKTRENLSLPKLKHWA